jgi:hypothetical protein
MSFGSGPTFNGPLKGKTKAFGPPMNADERRSKQCNYRRLSAFIGGPKCFFSDR